MSSKLEATYGPVSATFHPHPSYTAMEAAWARHHERQGEPDASNP